MATALKPLVVGVRSLVENGAVLVALSSPLNWVLMLLCHGVLERLGGGDFADNSGGLLLLLAASVNVGLFLAACGVALLAFVRCSARRRRAAIIILLLHLGCSLGWSFAVVAHMAATGVWL